MNIKQAQEQIANDLLSCGLKRGDIVLTHSSLSSMDMVPGGPETVIAGLMAVLGPEGTLLMPALSFKHVTPEHPIFDVTETPSNVGILADYFRIRPGTLRSVHPTHSVCAAGAHARELLAEHHHDMTPCGEHSPYRRLRDRGGRILFLGCGLRPNTSMHGVEELAEVPYLLGPTVSCQIILADRTRISLNFRFHSNFAGLRQRYDRIQPLLRDSGLRTGNVLTAHVHLVECDIMWEVALKALREDAYFFVEHV